MRVFVTGASGLVGGAVARQLRAAGHAVTALARSDASAAALNGEGFEVWRGDIENPEGLTPALAAAEGVVHAAVGMGNGVGPADEKALDLMIEALAGRNAPLILTSGIAVFSGAPGSYYEEEIALDEAAPAQLPLLRLEERAIRSAGRGVRAIVLRPSSVFGHGRIGSVTRRQIDFAERIGAGAYVGEGLVPYTAVHVDDLAAAYAAALERAPASSCYNIIGQTLTTRDLALAISHAVGVPGRTVSLTPAEARETFGQMAELMIKRPIVSGARAVLELGWTPQAPGLAYELAHGSLCRAGRRP